MKLLPLLLAALVFTGPVQDFDAAVRARVLASRSPVLDAPMRFASDRARVVLIAGAALALASGPAARLVLTETAIALIPVNLVVEALKYTVDRIRPDGTHKRSNSAFPSSHAANAFAVATVVSRRWRRSGWALVPFAALVAFSRMYLDRHWASDVLMGVAIGVAGAWLAGDAWARWRASRVSATA